MSLSIQDPESRTAFLNVDGVRVRYTRMGSGPIVLLLHGMMGTLSDWQLVFGPLAAYAEVVALDLPPFGMSDKPPVVYSLAFYADVLTRFVAALGLRDVTLVGHSFGGKVASYTAAMHPEWVSGLVLVASDGYLEKPKHYRAFAYEPLMRLTTKLAARFLPRFARGVFAPGTAIPAAFLRDAGAFFRDPATPRALAAVGRSERALDLMASDAAPLLAHLAAPVHILHGMKDRVMDPADARRAAAFLPHATLTLLPDTGHVIQIEQPQAVIDTVLAMLTKGASYVPAPVHMTPDRTRITQEGNS